MKEYTKIPAVFKRDIEGTKKLIDGEYISKEVAFLADTEWICTEKIDGTNIGVVWDGHRVSYQGRTEKAQRPKHLLQKLDSIFGTPEAEEMFEQLFGDKEFILFGEGYGAKIQKGECYIPDDCSFIMFDIFSIDSNLWLERESVEQIAAAFGVDVVPVVFRRGTLKKAVDYVKSKPDSLVGNCKMEGLVCHPRVDLLDRQGHRIIVKIKAVDF